jgi:hypothetical protein
MRGPPALATGSPPLICALGNAVGISRRSVKWFTVRLRLAGLFRGLHSRRQLFANASMAASRVAA